MSTIAFAMRARRTCRTSRSSSSAGGAASVIALISESASAGRRPWSATRRAEPDAPLTELRPQDGLRRTTSSFYSLAVRLHHPQELVGAARDLGEQIRGIAIAQ